MDIRKLQRIIVNALEDVKAKDIQVFNTTKQTALFDRVIIASANSNRQARALGHHVFCEVKENGGEAVAIEGLETGEWVLVDCGNVIVHILQPALRAYYNLEDLCVRYGEKRMTKDGTSYYDFPTAEALASAAVDDLRSCNLGYRSRYIHDTSVSVAHGEVNLEAVKHMEYEAARAELMKLCGVGVKVADCICLFALHQTDAFPKDTHIQKVLADRYPEGFPFEKYRGYAGILQQYIFYYDLRGGV